MNATQRSETFADGAGGDFFNRSVASSRLLFSAFTIAAFDGYSAFGSSLIFGSTFSPLIVLETNVFQKATCRRLSANVRTPATGRNSYLSSGNSSAILTILS